MATTVQSVRGMNDLLPTEAARWRRIEHHFFELASQYGFEEVRTPLVEPTHLFVRSIGDATDIVEKEMYTFVDKGEKSLTLRPEGTASCVRAFLEHKVYADSQVARWFYGGPMYRRERPAKGRYRQFHQLGAEVYGDAGPHSDAEVIQLAYRFVRLVGLDEVVVRVNSLGSGQVKLHFAKALTEFLQPHQDRLSEDSRRRVLTNPLRVLDSKAPQDQEVIRDAPGIEGFLSDEDRAHFDELRRLLDLLEVPYETDGKLVRGLDYYTRTLFELRETRGALGAQSTICGGGRYDGLVEELGGPATPSVGFAVGMERLTLTSPEWTPRRTHDAFMVSFPETTREAFRIQNELRQAGLRVEGDFRHKSMKSQMRRADRSGAPFAVIVGQDELDRNEVLVRHLADKTQRNLPIESLREYLRAHLLEDGDAGTTKYQ